MTNIAEIKLNLRQFTGTEHYYKNSFYPNFVYTDGIKYLGETANCYWLIDYIFSNQHTPKIRKEPFQVWSIKVKEDNTASIVVDDGNNNIIKQFKLGFTDFPIGLCEGEEGFSLYFTDRTLLLTSEY